jgi:hypothetical protein
MTESNLDVVRRIYDSGVWHSDSDPQTVFQWLAADFEFVNPPHAVVPGVRHGHEVAWFHDVDAARQAAGL